MNGGEKRWRNHCVSSASDRENAAPGVSYLRDLQVVSCFRGIQIKSGGCDVFSKHIASAAFYRLKTKGLGIEDLHSIEMTIA